MVHSLYSYLYLKIERVYDDMKKRVTINEIAKMAKTSKTTVSFYLNNKFEHMSEDTKNRIEKVIRETNYSPSIPAQSLKSNKMNLIGVLIGDITHSFANKLVKGINHSTREHGYQFIISETNYDPEIEAKYISQMISMGVDGFIVQPTKKFSDNLPLIRSSQKKVVFVDSTLDSEEFLSVSANHYVASKNAAIELKNNNYEQIYILSANPKIISTRRDRIDGFVDGFGEAYQDKITKIFMREQLSQEEINKTIDEIIEEDRKSLIVVVNCWMLPAVYRRVLKDKELIPERISLIGFDNDDCLKIANPSVTTIVQPAYNEGKEAAKLLIRSIEDKNKVEDIESKVVSCEIVYGDTT